MAATDRNDNAAPRPGPRFSLVIPAYNEQDLLPRLLDSVEASRAAYSRGPEAVEVIVADNASTDRTAAVAAARGCRLAPVETRVIAAVRNGGAAIARGEVLAFVDADSLVHPRTFDTLDEALATGRCVGGATGVRLESWSLGLAVTYALLMPLVWLLRFDTGVVFCRRDDFDAVGGYDERHLYGEDVAFLFALRRLGKARGQRLVRATGAKAIASTRKYSDHGQWHFLTMAARLGWLRWRQPSAADEAARRYWYDVER